MHIFVIYLIFLDKSKILYHVQVLLIHITHNIDYSYSIEMIILLYKINLKEYFEIILIFLNH